MTTYPNNLQDSFNNLPAEPYHELLKKEEAQLALFIKELGDRTVFKIDNDITHARSILQEIKNSNADITRILNQYNQLHGEIITALGTIYPSFENITSSSASIADMSEFIIFLNKTKEDLLSELQSTPNNDSLHEIINLLNTKGEQLSVLHVQAMAKERIISEYPKPLDRILSLDKEKKCSLEKERAIAVSKDKIVTIKQLLNLLEKNKQINQLIDDFNQIKLSFDKISIAQNELSSIKKHYNILEESFLAINPVILNSLKPEKLEQINELTKKTNERISSAVNIFHQKTRELMTVKLNELENNPVLLAEFSEENSLENAHNSLKLYDDLLKEYHIIESVITNHLLSNFSERLKSLGRKITEKRSNLLEIITSKLAEYHDDINELTTRLMQLKDEANSRDNLLVIKQQFTLITKKNQLFEAIGSIEPTDHQREYLQLKKAIERADISQQFLFGLDAYLNQRTYPVKDIVIPSDKNKRNKVIEQIKKSLLVFATTGETDNVLEILKNNKFSGNTLQPLLNRLIIALSPHEIDSEISQEILKDIYTKMHNQNAILAKQIADLYNAIYALKLQGEKIKETDLDSGLVAVTLANDLSLYLDNFLVTHQETIISADSTIYDQFKENFKIHLYSQTDAMKKHRAVWKPIIANIFIAIATLGVAPAVQLLISKLTGERRATFFFQDTKRLNLIAEINETAQRIVPAA